MADPNWRAWAHVVTSTRGQWLPGDRRGFRSRQHRVHSSGDYRRPPPPGEHEGLRKVAEAISTGPVFLATAHRRVVVEAIQTKLTQLGAHPRVIACDGVHCHALFNCDGDAVRLFGRAKQAASHALREQIPGRVWGRSSHVERIKDESHYLAVIRYVLAHQDRGAIVWEPERSGLR